MRLQNATPGVEEMEFDRTAGQDEQDLPGDITLSSSDSLMNEMKALH